MGTWVGLHNTRESIGAQLLISVIVLGTWRVARWKAKRKYTGRHLPVIASPAPTPSFVCRDRPATPAATAEVPAQQALSSVN
jgi:hypothetical protein